MNINYERTEAILKMHGVHLRPPVNKTCQGKNAADAPSLPKDRLLPGRINQKWQHDTGFVLAGVFHSARNVI